MYKAALLGVLLIVGSMVLADDVRYTLVLGLSNPGNGLEGYCDYARLHCPSELPCKVYDDLLDPRRPCNGFSDCVLGMMERADRIVFLTNKPEGYFLNTDELCDASNPAHPEDGEYTKIELCLVTHCCELYAKTRWVQRNSCALNGPIGDTESCGISLSGNDKCPNPVY